MPKNVHLICNAHLDPVWQWEWGRGSGRRDLHLPRRRGLL